MTQDTTIPSALLVSHGQPSDPSVGAAEIRQFAARVSAQCPGISVRGVSLAEPGVLEDLAAQAPPDTVIYPLFMADGWFTKVNLPRRLGGAPLAVLEPYGCDPGLAGFGAGWMRDVLVRSGWEAVQTDLVVVGHGSGRSARPAAVTRAFADAVQAQTGFRSLRVGFVEEDPRLADTLSSLTYRSICLPFFATRRGHVLEDLPEAVAESGYQGMVLPPIGLHPCTPGFIALSLKAALQARATAAVTT